MNPPFLPVSFPPGPPTAPAWESGPVPFVPYNGQNQTAKINVAAQPPPWELGPGPADPNISNVHTQAPVGNGYGPIGQGTVGVGNKIVVPPPYFGPAHLRFFIGSDGNLYALNNSGAAFVINPSAIVPVPSNYAAAHS